MYKTWAISFRQLFIPLACGVLFCSCLSALGQETTTVIRAISGKLGMPKAAADFLVADYLGPTSPRLDADAAHQRLRRLDATESLSVGLLMMSVNEPLQIRPLGDGPQPELLKNLLTKNAAGDAATLVRVEDISHLTFAPSGQGVVTGSFDWVIQELLTGKCHFVLEDTTVRYMGIPRTNASDFYDCAHLFSPAGDYRESRSWMVPVYFIAVRHEDPEGDLKSIAWQLDQMRSLLKGRCALAALDQRKALLMSTDDKSIWESLPGDLPKTWTLLHAWRTVLPRQGSVSDVVEQLQKGTAWDAVRVPVVTGHERPKPRQ